MLRETGQWLHSLDPQAVAALRGYHIPKPATVSTHAPPQNVPLSSTASHTHPVDAHSRRRPSTSGSVDAHVMYLANHLAAPITLRRGDAAAPLHTGGGPPLYRDPIYNNHPNTEEYSNGLVRDTTPQRNSPHPGGGRARRFSPSAASVGPSPAQRSQLHTTTPVAVLSSPPRRRYPTLPPPNTTNYSASMREGDTWSTLAAIAKEQADAAYGRRREEDMKSILKYQMVPSSKRAVPTLERDPRSLLDPSLLDDDDHHGDGNIHGEVHNISAPFASIHESGRRIQATNQAMSDARSGFSPAYVHGLRPTALDLERPLVYNSTTDSVPLHRITSPIKVVPTSRQVEVAIAIPPCDTLRSLRYKSARGELRQQERIRRENEAILYRLTPQTIALLNHLQDDEVYDRETHWMDWSRDFVDILTQFHAERDEASGRTRFREQMELSRQEMDERVYIQYIYKGEAEELGSLLSIMDVIIRPFCILAEDERLDRAQVVFVEGRYWEDIIKKEWESRAANPAFSYERDVYRRALIDNQEGVLDATIMKLSGVGGHMRKSNRSNNIVVTANSTITSCPDSRRHQTQQQHSTHTAIMSMQSPVRLRPMFEVPASPIQMLNSHHPQQRGTSSSTSSSIVGDADYLESDEIGISRVPQSISMSPARPHTQLQSPSPKYTRRVTPTDPLNDYVTSYWSKELRGAAESPTMMITPLPSAAVETRRDHSPSRFGDIHREQRYLLEERRVSPSTCASPLTTWRGETYRHDDMSTPTTVSCLKQATIVSPVDEVAPYDDAVDTEKRSTVGSDATPPHHIVEAIHTPSPYKNRHSQPTATTTTTLPISVSSPSSTSPSAGLVDFLYEKVSQELAKELASRRRQQPVSTPRDATTAPKQANTGGHNVSGSGGEKMMVAPSSKSIRSASGVIVGPYEDDIEVTPTTPPPHRSVQQESVERVRTSYPSLKSPKRAIAMMSPARGGGAGMDVVREASELLDQSPPHRRQQHHLQRSPRLIKAPASTSHHQIHTSPMRSPVATKSTRHHSPLLPPVSAKHTPQRQPSPQQKPSTTEITIRSPQRASTTPQGPTLHTMERALSRNRQHSASATAPPQSRSHQQQSPLRTMFAPNHLPSLGVVPHEDPTTESLVGTEGSYLSLLPGDDNIDAPSTTTTTAQHDTAEHAPQSTAVTTFNEVAIVPNPTSTATHPCGGGTLIAPVSEVSSSSSYCEAISIMARRHRQDPKTMQRALEAKFGYKGSKHEYAVHQAILDYERKMAAFEACRSRVVEEKTNRHQIRSYPPGVQTEGGLPLELHIKDRVNITVDDDTHPYSPSTPSPQEIRSEIPLISTNRRNSMGLNRDSPSAVSLKGGGSTTGSRTAIMGDLLLKSDVELIFASPVKETRHSSIAEPSQSHRPAEEENIHPKENSSSPHCPAATATRSSTSHIRPRTAPASSVSNPQPHSDAYSLEDIAEGRVDLLMSPPSHVNHHRDGRPLEDVCKKNTSPPRPSHPSTRHQYLEEEY